MSERSLTLVETSKSGLSSNLTGRRCGPFAGMGSVTDYLKAGHDRYVNAHSLLSLTRLCETFGLTGNRVARRSSRGKPYDVTMRLRAKRLRWTRAMGGGHTRSGAGRKPTARITGSMASIQTIHGEWCEPRLSRLHLRLILKW